MFAGYDASRGDTSVDRAAALRAAPGRWIDRTAMLVAASGADAHIRAAMVPSTASSDQSRLAERCNVASPSCVVLPGWYRDRH